MGNLPSHLSLLLTHAQIVILTSYILSIYCLLYCDKYDCLLGCPNRGLPVLDTNDI